MFAGKARSLKVPHLGRLLALHTNRLERHARENALAYYKDL